jgi:predicted GTPase
VSPISFGEPYFSARESLCQILYGIDSLAYDSGTQLTALSPPENIHYPFLFLAFGEINAGKSSFLNSLFATDLCPVNILPETNEVIHYHSKNSDLTSNPFLRDFQLIDTPGTNNPNHNLLEATAEFIPQADLIFFVFPVTNPWEANTWNLISSIPQDCLHRIVIIIQQADLRDPADHAVISQHVADLAMKRIGTVPPIFPVSAKIALLAKTSSSTNRNLYIESGFQALENFISTHICLSPQRISLLHSWRNHAASTLRTIEEHIDSQSRALSQQNHFLSSLENEIESMREKLIARVPRHLVEVTEIFDKEAFLVTKSLRRKLSLIPSTFRIFFGDRTGSSIEQLLIDRLRAAVESVAEHDGRDIVTACRNHWHDLDTRVRESIGTSIAQSVPIDSNLEQARIRFVSRIGRAAQTGIGNLSVRKNLERNIRRRNIALKSFTATTLIFLILSATVGILNLPWLPIIFASIALLFSLIGATIALITKNRVARDFRHSLQGTCSAFADALRQDYEDAIHSFFQDYTSCLGALRSHLANEKLAIEPKLQRWQNLFLSLKAIEQNLP